MLKNMLQKFFIFFLFLWRFSSHPSASPVVPSFSSAENSIPTAAAWQGDSQPTALMLLPFRVRFIKFPRFTICQQKYGEMCVARARRKKLIMVEQKNNLILLIFCVSNLEYYLFYDILSNAINVAVFFLLGNKKWILLLHLFFVWSAGYCNAVADST